MALDDLPRPAAMPNPTAKSRSIGDQEAAWPCRPDGLERRIVGRALIYWQALRSADGSPPPFEQIDLGHSSELSPYLYLVDLNEGAERPRFHHAGDMMIRAFGGDPSGRPIKEAMPRPFGERLADFVVSSALYRQALADSDRHGQPGKAILYRNIIMPLVDPASDRVTHCLGAFSFCHAI